MEGPATERQTASGPSRLGIFVFINCIDFWQSLIIDREARVGSRHRKHSFDCTQRVREGYTCQVIGSARQERSDTLPVSCPLKLAVPTQSDQSRPSILRAQYLANLAIDPGRILRCLVNQV